MDVNPTGSIKSKGGRASAPIWRHPQRPPFVGQSIVLVYVNY